MWRGRMKGGTCRDAQGVAAGQSVPIDGEVRSHRGLSAVSVVSVAPNLLGSVMRTGCIARRVLADVMNLGPKNSLKGKEVDQEGTCRDETWCYPTRPCRHMSENCQQPAFHEFVAILSYLVAENSFFQYNVGLMDLPHSVRWMSSCCGL